MADRYQLTEEQQAFLEDFVESDAPDVGKVLDGIFDIIQNEFPAAASERRRLLKALAHRKEQPLADIEGFGRALGALRKLSGGWLRIEMDDEGGMTIICNQIVNPCYRDERGEEVPLGHCFNLERTYSGDIFGTDGEVGSDDGKNALAVLIDEIRADNAMFRGKEGRIAFFKGGEIDIVAEKDFTPTNRFGGSK